MKLKFAIGDRVRLTEDESRLSDIESDLQLNVMDRTITGRHFDAITKAISERKVWKIIAVEPSPFGDHQPEYEIQLEGSKWRLPMLLEPEDMIHANYNGGKQ